MKPGDVDLIYCVVPRAVPLALFELLRSHYRGEPSVEVIAERRISERRRAPERRGLEHGSPLTDADRRRVRSRAGRRVGERRAPLVTATDLPQPLPPEAAPYERDLVFVARQVPATTELEDLDSRRLVTRFQAGDTDVFEDLYMRYFDRVYSYLRMTLRDGQDVEDATQEVFARVLVSLERYEQRGRPFRAWLFTLVRNLAFDRLRLADRLAFCEPAELPEPVSDERDEDALAWISDRRLLRLIERLPQNQRQVLLLRYLLDLKVHEIASIMGIAPNNVSVMHSRALSFLRERLGAMRVDAPGGRPVAMSALQHSSPVLRSRRAAVLY